LPFRLQLPSVGTLHRFGQNYSQPVLQLRLSISRSVVFWEASFCLST
jgi:hypothetical protein